MGKGRAGLALILGLAALVVPASAQAARAVALLPGNTIATFDTGSPNALTYHDVTGLGANETVRAIDVRPADGALYAVTVTSASAANSVVRTYTVDPDTGAAVLVGATAAALAGAGDVASGLDFNPVADRIRYTNTNDENARINPASGALSADDTDITPAATSALIGAAYDRNEAGGTATTAFVIDRNDSQVARLGGPDGTPSPNTGVATDFGALGFTLNQTRDGGFDIAPSGTAFAALTDDADDRTRLYTIDLVTGAATAVGILGGGSAEVFSLAIRPDLPPPPPAPPPPVDTSPPNVLVDASRTARYRTVLRSRLRLNFSCDEACGVAAVLSRGRTVLARGDAGIGQAGVARLRLLVTRAGRRGLTRLQRTRGARRATLTLTFTDAAGNVRTVTRRLSLSR